MCKKGANDVDEEQRQWRVKQRNKTHTTYTHVHKLAKKSNTFQIAYIH